MSNIRLAGTIKESIVDGPGIRYVIFTQGCSHNCKGCHNPETHSFCGGYTTTTSELLEDISKYRHIDGVTLSGGDPMYQPEQCLEIVSKLKENNINVICYTGFTYEQIVNGTDKNRIELLSKVDTLIDGPFIEEERDLRLAFRGSRNQRIIDVEQSMKCGHVVISNIGS